MYYQDDGQGRSAVRFARVLGAPTSGGRPGVRCDKTSITRPGAVAPDGAWFACCGQANPVVTRLTWSGLVDPIVPQQLESMVNLGTKGVAVVVPDGTRPLVSQASVGYIYPQLRDSGATMFGYPFDFARYCQASAGGAPRNIDGTAYGWRCGDAQIDVNGGCRDQHGDGFRATLRGDAPGKPDDWVCNGPKIPVFTATGASGVALKTLQGPVDVITALDPRNGS